MLKYFVGGEVVHKAPLPEECPALPVAQRLYDTVPAYCRRCPACFPRRKPGTMTNHDRLSGSVFVSAGKPDRPLAGLA